MSHAGSSASALCRPVELYGPATRTSCFSSACFPQSSSPLPRALCLPPYFPCFPGLICHCGLIISACSWTSSGRLTFHVVSSSSGTFKVCQRKAAAAGKTVIRSRAWRYEKQMLTFPLVLRNGGHLRSIGREVMNKNPTTTCGQ